MRDAFKVLVYTPAGLPDPGLAIAATRAGHAGVLVRQMTRGFD